VTDLEHGGSLVVVLDRRRPVQLSEASSCKRFPLLSQVLGNFGPRLPRRTLEDLTTPRKASRTERRTSR
jgi:hypothetical protein